MKNYQDKLDKLSNENRIHNLLITYAYNTADDIRQTSTQMLRSIESKQPSSAEVNECLLLQINIDNIARKLNLLKEIQTMSIHLYRIINKHE